MLAQPSIANLDQFFDNLQFPGLRRVSLLQTPGVVFPPCLLDQRIVPPQPADEAIDFVQSQTVELFGEYLGQFHAQLLIAVGLIETPIVQDLLGDRDLRFMPAEENGRFDKLLLPVLVDGMPTEICIQ